MNEKTIELLRNPEKIQLEDLIFLKKEISSNPYLQSVRAIYLLGAHRLDPSNYSQILSTTAAYTTDKKILYQLINGKSSPYSEIQEEEQANKTENNGLKNENIEDLSLGNNPNPQPLEETLELSQKEIEEIPAQITELSPKIHILETEKNENSEEKPIQPFIEEATGSQTTVKEITLNQKEDPQEVEIISLKEILEENDTKEPQETSHFQEVDVAPQLTPQNTQESKPRSKYQEEMQRLIEEVERKMKEKKNQYNERLTKEEEEVILNSDISFAETQEFNILPEKETPISQTAEFAEIPKKNEEEKTLENRVSLLNSKTLEESKSPTLSNWKPMQFTSNLPDSLIKPSIEKTEKPAEKELQPEKTIETREKASNLEEIASPEMLSKEKEPKVMTVSFFSPEILSLENKDVKIEPQVPLKSNVPVFINTWQNWLQIDRKEDKDKEIPKEEIKIQAIEKFIETEPKISQLKTESDFVVKEKTNDISHLTTETLAQLYTAQKLYTKALNAYKILQEKFPEKKDYFEGKITEIHDLKQR